MKKIHITPGVIKRFKQFLTGKYIEDGATASQNIPAGKWIIWKGQACYAKTAITQGDTLSSTNLDTDEEGMMNSKHGWVYFGQPNPSSSGASIDTTAIEGKEWLIIVIIDSTSMDSENKEQKIVDSSLLNQTGNEYLRMVTAMLKHVSATLSIVSVAIGTKSTSTFRLYYR